MGTAVQVTPGLPEEDKPRVLMNMTEKVGRDLQREREQLAQDRADFERDKNAERVQLNTQRDIKCYVMTFAELSSLIMANNILVAISLFIAVVLLLSITTVVWFPHYTQAALFSSGLITVGGGCGMLIGVTWRSQIIKEIQNFGNSEN
jgi:hypothetical protein